MIKFIDLLRESYDDDEYGYDSTEHHKITPETIKKIKSTDRIILGTEDKLDLSRKFPPSLIKTCPKTALSPLNADTAIVASGIGCWSVISIKRKLI